MGRLYHMVQAINNVVLICRRLTHQCHKSCEIEKHSATEGREIVIREW
jgi:hypothetical protein